MSFGGFANVVGDCSFEVVIVEKMSEDVGETSVVFQIVVDEGVKMVRGESQICNGEKV